MTSYSAPLKGIVHMIAAVFLLSMSDAAAKWLAPHYSAVQIVCVRALLGLGPALGLVLWEKGRRGLMTRHLFAHTVRSLLMLLSWLFFIMAIRSMPLATAYTLVFGAPLFATLLSRIFLGEEVSAPRWVAVLGGFIGVVIVVSPASIGLGSASVLALLAAMMWAVTSIVARRLSQKEPSTRILFYYMAISAGTTTPIALNSWTPIALAHLPIFIITGVVGVAAHWLLAQAFRYGEVSVIAPFEYTGLVWAMALGYWLWDDAPTLAVMCGGVLIIASGMYVAHYENRQQTASEGEQLSEKAKDAENQSVSA